MPRKAETYESIMLKLENIVASMDSSELSLESSIKSYEEGVKLCNKLYKILNDAEEKIKVLTEEGEKDFNIEC
ncbi:exodeoxyribonuclease VII small subunit [Clostridium sp. BJN0013]|uniref:exodeoxyribonuclease VII small subunit n=1 Tax=Clostridium sp. BJN0013 TaxID=3236840 RepID=UPI0034C68CBB